LPVPGCWHAAGDLLPRFPVSPGGGMLRSERNDIRGWNEAVVFGRKGMRAVLDQIEVTLIIGHQGRLAGLAAEVLPVSWSFLCMAILQCPGFRDGNKKPGYRNTC